MKRKQIYSLLLAASLSGCMVTQSVYSEEGAGDAAAEAVYEEEPAEEASTENSEEAPESEAVEEDIPSGETSEETSRESSEEVSAEASRELRNIRRKQSCIPHLEIMARELGLPAEEFIAKYAYIRRGSGTNAERLTAGLRLGPVDLSWEGELGVDIRELGQSLPTGSAAAPLYQITFKTAAPVARAFFAFNFTPAQG